MIVSGVEGAGKGTVVNRLNRWLDTRGIETHAFWDETEDDRQRPRFWRFWQALPRRGTVGIMFGSWYTHPIIDHVYARSDASRFDRELVRIAEFERMLIEDGALIVKFWFHLSKSAQKKKLKRESKGNKRSSPLLKRFSKRYDQFSSVSERAIRMTDTGVCPWHIVEATDGRYRDLTFGRILLNAIQQRIEVGKAATSHPPVHELVAIDVPKAKITILDRVDMKTKLSDKSYRRLLRKYQDQIGELTWRARAKKRFTVAVMEGWDAAGKGGAIRRVTGAIDARL